MAVQANAKRACEGVLPACQYEEASGATPLRPYFASLVDMERATDAQRLTAWRTLQDRGAVFERYCSRCPILDAEEIAEGAALLALARSAVATGAPSGSPLFKGVEAYASVPTEAERRMLRDARAARMRIASGALAEGHARLTALLALDPARASRRIAARLSAGEISAPVARGLTLAYERGAQGLEAELAKHRAALDDPGKLVPGARTSADARHDEISYHSKFRQRVEQATALPDARTGRAWAVARIQEIPAGPDAHRDVGEIPVGIASRFVLSSRVWWLFGMLRPKLVVEARTLARRERFERLGYDDEPFALADINRVLDAERGRSGPTHAVALVSLTGWADDAVARVRAGWSDPTLLLVLVDARSGAVHAHDALRASHDALLRLFVPETREEEKRRAVHAVRDALLLAIHDEVSAAETAAASGLPLESVADAMRQLESQEWGAVVKRSDGAGFRRREGKDLGELA